MQEVPKGGGSVSIFQAVWPVIDQTKSWDELKQEALDDLHCVARRHGVITAGEATAVVRLGGDVPGAGPSSLVVVVESPVAEFDYRPAPDDPHEMRACLRCGFERNAAYSGRDYCSDCKRFAKADGWLEAA